MRFPSNFFQKYPRGVCGYQMRAELRPYLFFLVDRVMTNNPGFKLSNLIEMGLAKLFGDVNPECQDLYEADQIRFHPDFTAAATSLAEMKKQVEKHKND